MIHFQWLYNISFFCVLAPVKVLVQAEIWSTGPTRQAEKKNLPVYPSDCIINSSLIYIYIASASAVPAAYIQVCRGLMISAVCLGFFGAILALVGMKCTKIGGSETTKARITCLCGLHFILSGKCRLIGHSFFSKAFAMPTFQNESVL